MRRPFLLLLLTLGVAQAQEPAPPPQDLASLVPAEALLLVDTDDLGGFERWTRETALGRIWAEPEMQHFVKGVTKAFADAMERFGGGFNPLSMIGLEQEDFEGIAFRRAGLAVLDVSFDGNLRLDAVFTLQFRSGAENGRKIIDALRRSIEQFLPFQFEPIEVAGETVLRLDAPLGYSIFTFTKGDRFVLTMSRPRMEQVLTALQKGHARSLRAAPAFRKIRQRMGADRFSGLVYANVPRLRARALAIAAQAVPRAEIEHFEAVWGTLGLDAVEAFAFADIPEGTGFRSELAVTLSERRGLFGLMPQGKPSHRFAVHAPAGALAYGAEVFDAEATLNGVLGLLGSLDPEARREVEEGLARANEMLGIDLRRDMLAALGTEWAAYVAAPPGGGVFPDFALFVTLRDRARLEKAVDTILARLPALAAGEGVLLQARETEFRGARIRYLQMAKQDGDAVPVAPAWAFGDDFAVFALVPQTIKHAFVEKASLAAKPDYRALLRTMPESAVSMTYIDMQGAVGWLYNSAVPMLQVVQGALNRELALYGIEINLADLPTSHVITRHLSGMMSYTAVENDCVRTGFVSSFGAGLLVVPVAMLAGVTGTLVYRGKVEEQKRMAARARLHARETEVEKLRAENEMLRRRLAVIERQIAELRKLMEERDR